MRNGDIMVDIECNKSEAQIYSDDELWINDGWSDKWDNTSH